MLACWAKRGIITTEEADLPVNGLMEILENQRRLNPLEGTERGYHSFIEARLVEKVGDVGKKLHTARSRNDQVPQTSGSI